MPAAAKTRRRKSAGRRPDFVLADVDNPEFRQNEIFPASESLRHPRCREIRRKYKLDAVVKGERDEFARILLLRHWIKKHIRINNKYPTRTRGDAFGILDAALRGGGFHCAHFSIVQQAVYNSFGYVTRRLGAGPGEPPPGRGGHHGVNEVWVNDLLKWVLIDAKYDLHFEKDGVPMSALEVRDEVIRNGGVDVRRTYGPERKHKRRDFPESTHTYRWVSWEIGARFTDWPSAVPSALVVYDDDFYRKNTWYRDGKPHWAYKADYFVPVRRRSWIEWTPNVISSRVHIDKERARVSLRSCTPNLKTYQMRRGSSRWQDCEESVEIRLGRRGASLAFRTVNLAGLKGPDHRVEVVPAAP